MANTLRRNLGLAAAALLVAACQRPAGVLPTPTAFATFTPLGPESASETPAPTEPGVTLLPPTEETLATETPAGEEGETPLPTVEQTSTSTASPTLAATATTAAATPSGPAIDPNTLWGPPNFSDPMETFSDINWEGSDGKMPDTQNLRLTLQGGDLFVTGKQLGFETWWFTWPFLGDAYVEMTVETDACAGKDAYGLIVRGPAKGVTPGHGYVVAFSCDGNYQLRRIDGTDPFSAVDLISWTGSTAIKAGSNQTNQLGVRMEGNTISIYANRFKVAEFTDNRYVEGRYGVWVRPSLTNSFTYRVDVIEYWKTD